MMHQNPTNPSSTIPTSTTMEADFPPAPVELPSWMLKESSMSQTAAAVAALAAATAAETSPVWSSLGDDFSHPSEHDPSPSLSDSLTFDELLSSCNPSPLFDDMPYSAVGGGLADVPLFGSYAPMSQPAVGQQSKDRVSSSLAAGVAGVTSATAPSGFGGDFTLFPDAPISTSTSSTAPTLLTSTTSTTTTSPLQMALDGLVAPELGSKETVEYIYRALTAAAQGQPAPSAPVASTSSASSSPMLWSTNGRPSMYPSVSAPALTSFQFTPPVTTAPTATTTTTATDPVAEPTTTTTTTPAIATSSSTGQGNKRSSSRKTSVLGVKRRADADELLPLDAPIQERSYRAPSATSRKDLSASTSASTSTANEAAPPTPAAAEPDSPSADVIPEGLSAMEAKRLSNTLAARRSRHRKAEDLRVLHETIDSLKEEVQQWKRRCMRAEEERDKAGGA
ncbi:unnamed protein product [Tilletia controversa]|nr:unnamed protein product [Tilletia controversa]